MSLALFQNDSHETGSEGRACARHPSGFKSRLVALLYDYRRVRADPPAKSVYFARVSSTGRSSRGPTLVRSTARERHSASCCPRALEKACRILEICALILWSFLNVESSAQRGGALQKYCHLTFSIYDKVGRFVF